MFHKLIEFLGPSNDIKISNVSVMCIVAWQRYFFKATKISEHTAVYSIYQILSLKRNERRILQFCN